MEIRLALASFPVSMHFLTKCIFYAFEINCFDPCNIFCIRKCFIFFTHTFDCYFDVRFDIWFMIFMDQVSFSRYVNWLNGFNKVLETSQMFSKPNTLNNSNRNKIYHLYYNHVPCHINLNKYLIRQCYMLSRSVISHYHATIHLYYFLTSDFSSFFTFICQIYIRSIVWKDS